MHQREPRHPRRILLAAATLGVAAELLVDGSPLGVSVPLLALGFLGALGFLAGHEGRHRARRVTPLAVPLLALAGFVAVRSSPDLVTLNVLACLALAGLLAHGFDGTVALADLKL